MKFLMKTTDVYRVDTEEDAMKLIQEFKDNQTVEGYTVSKSSYTLKTKKSKGEIVDSWYICLVERSFEE